MILDLATVIALINKKVANVQTTGLTSVELGEDNQTLVFTFSDGKKTEIRIDGLLSEEQEQSIEDIENKADKVVVGDLTSLTTKDKTSIVNAINSIKYNSSNIEMESGYSVEEFATEVFSAMSEEFISEDGNEILTENVLPKSKLLGYEMKGQTINNVLLTEDEEYVVEGDGKFYKGFSIELEKAPKIKPNLTYTVIAFVTENTLTVPFKAEHGYETNAFIGDLLIPQGKTGIFSAVLTTKEDFAGVLSASKSVVSDKTGVGVIRFRKIILEGEIQVGIDTFVPHGLTSTKAIVNIDNKEYPIFDPATKAVIELNQFKSSADVLIRDSEDRVVVKRAVGRLTLTGDEEGWSSFSISSGGLGVANLPLDGIKVENNSTLRVMSDKLPCVAWDNSWTFPYEHITISGVGAVVVRLKAKDIDELKARVKELNLTIVYQLSEVSEVKCGKSTSIGIPASEMIISCGDILKPVDFKVVLPVDKFSKMQKDIEGLKARVLITGTQS